MPRKQHNRVQRGDVCDARLAIEKERAKSLVHGAASQERQLKKSTYALLGLITVGTWALKAVSVCLFVCSHQGRATSSW